jgi:hypothetical protein
MWSSHYRATARSNRCRRSRHHCCELLQRPHGFSRGQRRSQRGEETEGTASQTAGPHERSKRRQCTSPSTISAVCIERWAKVQRRHCAEAGSTHTTAQRRGCLSAAPMGMQENSPEHRRAESSVAEHRCNDATQKIEPRAHAPARTGARLATRGEASHASRGGAVCSARTSLPNAEKRGGQTMQPRTASPRRPCNAGARAAVPQSVAVAQLVCSAVPRENGGEDRQLVVNARPPPPRGAPSRPSRRSRRVQPQQPSAHAAASRGHAAATGGRAGSRDFGRRPGERPTAVASQERQSDAPCELHLPA